MGISTYGDEITVAYNYFHCHFGYNVRGQEDYDEAIKMIKEIINEEILVVMGTMKGKWTFSFFIKEEKRPSMKIPYDKYDTINIKSWNGTFNEIIRI